MEITLLILSAIIGTSLSYLISRLDRMENQLHEMDMRLDALCEVLAARRATDRPPS
jgi:hypothetical protein